MFDDERDTPIQFQLPQPQIIEVMVLREKVNAYLSLLWDKFSEEFGNVSCTHRYTNLPHFQNPELYSYQVEWSHSNFFARIEFLNHTARGIRYIHVAVIEKKTKIEDIETTNTIIKLIHEAQNQIDRQVSTLPSAIVKIPILTKYLLEGLYWLEEDVAIFPSIVPAVEERSVTQDELKIPKVSFLEFPLFEFSDKQQYAEAYSKGFKIAATLSLLTQNLFICNFDRMEFFSPEVSRERHSVLEAMNQGNFIEDFGLFEEQPYKDESGTIDIKKSREIIESGDVIFNRKINLPKSTSDALKVVLENDTLCQAAKRFQEGLILGQEILSAPQGSKLGLMIVPYQIIAFVASIEALLDTSPKNLEIPCPACGTPILVQEQKIVKTFHAFVEDLLGNNLAIKKMFQQLYQDRSKFVHTGKDLYDPLAFLGNRPLILNGKNYRRTLPDYYFNIGDFTGLLLRRYIYRKITR